MTQSPALHLVPPAPHRLSCSAQGCLGRHNAVKLHLSLSIGLTLGLQAANSLCFRSSLPLTQAPRTQCLIMAHCPATQAVFPGYSSSTPPLPHPVAQPQRCRLLEVSYWRASKYLNHSQVNHRPPTSNSATSSSYIFCWIIRNRSFVSFPIPSPPDCLFGQCFSETILRNKCLRVNL